MTRAKRPKPAKAKRASPTPLKRAYAEAHALALDWRGRAEAAEAKLREAEQGAEWSKMMHREQWKRADAAVEALKEARRWLRVDPSAARLAVETIDEALASEFPKSPAPPPDAATVAVPRALLEDCREWIADEATVATGRTSADIIERLTAALDAALAGRTP